MLVLVCPLLLRKMLIPQMPVYYQEVVSDLVLEQHFGAGRKGGEMEKQVSPPCGAQRE